MVQIRDDQFEREEDELLRARFRTAALTCLILNAAFALVDWLTLGPEALHLRTAVRLAFTAGYAALMVGASTRGAALHPQALVLLLSTVLSVELGILGAPLAAAESVGVFPSLLFFAAFLPMPLSRVGLMAAIFVAGFAGLHLWLGGSPAAAVIKHAANIATAGVIAVVAASMGRTLRKSEFAARQRLGAANARLRELDKVKSQFFADVSHELRTPLTAALLTLGEGPDEHAAKRPLRRLHKLVEELLELSRIDAGAAKAQAGSVDLGAAAARIVAEFSSAFTARRIELRIEAPEGPVAARIGAGALEKIAVNLVGNALKYVPAGGHVLVRALRDADAAVLEVKDDGPGIAAEDVPRVFERFVRLSGSEGAAGSGIGLALARELAELHGGRMTCESEPGKGTTFRARFPPAESAQEAPAPAQDGVQDAIAAALDGEPRPKASPPSPPPFTAGARVLVVEDHADVADHVAAALGRSASVRIARDAPAALEMARRDPPDLIVCDVLLPGMTGFSLVRKLREEPALHGAAILMLTALADREHILEGLSAGADDYLPKPFDVGMLRARAEALLRLKRRRDVEVESRRLVHTVSAQDAERRRLARDLHDGTGQVLIAALLHLDLGLAGPQDADAVRRGRALVQQGLQEIRSLARDLHPPGLARDGLVETLRGLASTLSGTGIDVSAAISAELPRELSPDLTLGVYRIAQAALANAARHSRCRNVKLELRPEEENLVLLVEDDGVGFLPARTGQGVGLSGMRERAASLGGTLTIESDLGRGTRLRASLPMEHARA